MRLFRRKPTTLIHCNSKSTAMRVSYHYGGNGKIKRAGPSWKNEYYAVVPK